MCLSMKQRKIYKELSKTADRYVMGGRQMCGRFRLDSEIDEIAAKYRVDYKEVDEYNVGDFYPSQGAAIILGSGRRVLTLAKWGFTNNYNRSIVINARSETITERPMFKDSFYSARCIIPANLFYEWKDEGKSKKVKYKIGLKGRDLISLGGIYKLSIDENQKKHISFVIITTEAEGDIKDVHHRMPLIIDDEKLGLWLDNNTPLQLVKELLKPSDSLKFKIEKCEDKLSQPNGEHYEQMSMF